MQTTMTDGEAQRIISKLRQSMNQSGDNRCPKDLTDQDWAIYIALDAAKKALEEKINREKEEAEAKETAHKQRSHNRETLCWKCRKACGGCSWSAADPDGTLRFEKVKGWVAEKRSLSKQSGVWTKYTTGYCVLSCPEFEPDKPRKRLPRAEKGIGE